MAAGSDPTLIAEQLAHTLDLMRAEIDKIRAEQSHQRELFEHRLHALETARDDHENRLRQVQEASTQFKFLTGLAAGGGLLSIIALIKALIGQ
jgi:hypothetical protein